MMFPSKSSLVLCSVLSFIVLILLNENHGSTVANKHPAMKALRRIGRNITADTVETMMNWDSLHQQPSPQHKQNCMTKYPPIRNGEVHVYFVLPRLQMLTTKCPPPERLTTEEDITTQQHTKIPTTTASMTTASTTPTITTPTTTSRIIFVPYMIFPSFLPIMACRPKFIRLGDKCYHFSEKKEIWSDASLICPATGGDLAHPNQTENQILKDHLSKLYRRENWWIGGAYQVTERRYIWVHDRNKIIFFDWDKPQMPDKESYERDCILMKKKDFTWDVEYCFDRFRYICEHSLNVSLINSP